MVGMTAGAMTTVILIPVSVVSTMLVLNLPFVTAVAAATLAATHVLSAVFTSFLLVVTVMVAIGATVMLIDRVLAVSGVHSHVEGKLIEEFK